MKREVCKHCGKIVPTGFRRPHLKKAHGIFNLSKTRVKVEPHFDKFEGLETLFGEDVPRDTVELWLSEELRKYPAEQLSKLREDEERDRD